MTLRKGASEIRAYIITGPTSGVGHATALVMAKEGTLVLVGRNLDKLRDVQKAIAKVGGQAVPIVCDMSDLRSVHRAAAEILSLDLKLVGLLNNAGIQNPSVTKTADGWDNTFVTNHIGPLCADRGLAAASRERCEYSLRWFSHGRSRAQACGAGGFSRWPLPLCRSKFARRMESRWVRQVRDGCLCHVEAVQHRYSAGACA